MDYFNALRKNLNTLGFGEIKGFQIVDKDNNIKYIGTLKTDTPIWYSVILYDLNNISYEEIDLMENRYNEFYEEIAKEYNSRKIVVLNLLVNKDLNEELISYINSKGEYIDSKIDYVYWGVSGDGDTYISENQLSNIVGVEKLIKKTAVSGDITESSKGDNLKPREDYNGYVSIGLIGINVLVFILMTLNGGTQNPANLIRFGAIEPGLILYGHEYYRLFTSMFIHIGFSHLFYNCVSIYIFGARVEKYYGKSKYLLIYILSGIVGSIFSVFLTKSIAAGASGAIYGLVGAIGALAWRSKKNVDGLNGYMMIIYILVSIGLGSLDRQIDNFAHLGGLFAGIFISYGLLILKERKEKE